MLVMQWTDFWTAATAIGTVSAAVVATVAVVLSLRTLREMQADRALSVRPYLDFVHDSFRRRVSQEWQQMTAAQHGQAEFISLSANSYDVHVRNVGKGPAIGCYVYSYCPCFETDGTVSTRYFRTDWFNVGPDCEHTTSPAFLMQGPSQDEARQVLALAWTATRDKQASNSAGAGLKHDPRAQHPGAPLQSHVAMMEYLRDNSAELMTYHDQFGRAFMRIRGIVENIPLPSWSPTPE